MAFTTADPVAAPTTSAMACEAGTTAAKNVLTASPTARTARKPTLRRRRLR